MIARDGCKKQLIKFWNKVIDPIIYFLFHSYYLYLICSLLNENVKVVIES